jgi:hypothetical protein
MIAHFALRLLCGISLMWCLMPRDKVTTGFFRIQMLVALGLSVLATLTTGQLLRAGSDLVGLLSPATARGICIFLIVTAFAGSVGWTLGRRPFGNAIVFLFAAVAFITLLLVSFVPDESPGQILLREISEISTAMILGAAVTSMLLGHWYLTSPTMSIDPLHRLTLLFFLSAVFRLIVSSIGLGFGISAIETQTQWTWLTLRWAAGIIGPLLLCVMVWRILKYRNTQSATGVLFAGVILTFIGELSAALLDKDLSHPF